MLGDDVDDGILCLANEIEQKNKVKFCLNCQSILHEWIIRPQHGDKEAVWYFYDKPAKAYSQYQCYECGEIDMIYLPKSLS
jgi:hypothetical protein